MGQHQHCLAVRCQDGIVRPIAVCVFLSEGEIQAFDYKRTQCIVDVPITVDNIGDTALCATKMAVADLFVYLVGDILLRYEQYW